MKKGSSKSRRSQVPAKNSFSSSQIKIGVILTIVVCLIITGVSINKVLSLQSARRAEIESSLGNATIDIQPSSQSSIIALKKENSPNFETVKASSRTQDIEVQKGDNFWKISKRACGKGNYYLEIKEDTGYANKALKAGDILTVDCSKY